VVAGRLGGIVRRHDTVARLGGDEFAILLDAPITLGEARVIADRAIDAIREPASIDGTEVSCAASVGIVLGNHTHDVDELLRNADLAMYAAKSQGKSQHLVFAREMHEAALHRLALDASLQRAVRDHELVVHYQPVWTLPDRHIEAVEALVRWQHPERGLLGPGEFIDHAERTGAIDQIGEYVLAAACRHLTEWQAALGAERTPRVSVNLSTRQLLDRRLAERVATVLERHRTPPSSIILEVTESALMRDPELAARSLNALHALGVDLAVDDFGTGYSSLAYLQRFPIDFLKIDKSFVDDLRAGDERSLPAAIVQLARTLGVTPVAEGVETPEQLAALCELGCDLAQGYFLARPMPADEVPDLLAKHRVVRAGPDAVPHPGSSPGPVIRRGTHA
jgi:Amt family ammonium transporter